MLNLTLIQMQFALFFDEIENRPDKLANKVEDALESLFDQMPTILPVPPEAPLDVPSVIMQSSDGVYTCNIAKTRIDFIVNSNGGHSISVGLDKFIDLINSFSEAVYSYKKVVRFGLIGRYFITDKDPVRKIKGKYFKGDLGELEELNIRFNKRFDGNNIVFNDIVEISKGNSNENGNITDGIFLQRDLNNVPVQIISMEEIFSIIDSHKDKFSQSGLSELIE